MPAKLTKEERLKLIERVILNKEPVSKVCQEVGISRVLFYRWLRRYKEEGEVAPKKPAKVKGTKIPEKQIKRVIEIVRKNPDFSSKKISEALGKDKKGKPFIGNHGVQNLLFRFGLNKKEKREYFAQKTKKLTINEAFALAKRGYPFRTPGEKTVLTPEERYELINKVINQGLAVSKVCQEYQISRPVFYKWLKRYRQAPKEEKLKALESKKPKVKFYWRQTPEKYEEAVLSLVAKHPEYGVRKLVANLPKVAGVPIVGHHGVQNILRRHNLSLFKQRKAYAQSQITPVTSLIQRVTEIFSRLFVFPPEKRAAIIRFVGISGLTAFSTVFIFGLLNYYAAILGQVPVASKIGLLFASLALFVGSIFFAYSMKYYLTLALVLSFSRRSLSEGGGVTLSLGVNGNEEGSSFMGWLKKIFGLNGENGNGKKNHNQLVPAGGLSPDLENVKISRYPFISVHIPLYNEKKVAERVITACSDFDYPNYEVIVCDDSSDETKEIVENVVKTLNQKNKNNPKIKILHRKSREGFKGGALAEALKVMDKKTEFVVVFDADFVPYPDTLIQFIKYLKATGGFSEEKSYRAETIRTIPYSTFEEIPKAKGIEEIPQGLKFQEKQLLQKGNVACIAGYQWHVLNKSENWITKGVRSEYAGSYVIERPGQEILGALKVIHGSVYCIRADVLKHFGWGTSITEDYELTLRIYERGFKVVYTPYIQAPSECVSTVKRLIRQRMRWAEGHSFNTKKWAKKLLFSPYLTLMEKLEFLYLSPYYLQSFFFLIGTFAWLISETVFRARLPFWTELWGWSLVLTNFFALPLVNTVGLFLEESEERDYLGILSFVALSYLLVPFQAYASVKGFLEKKEGPWFRTPKTGKITDVFTRGKFYRFIMGIFPGFKPQPAVAMNKVSQELNNYSFNPLILNYSNPYLVLATANNQFNHFKIKRRNFRFIGKAFLVFLLITSLLLKEFAYKVPLAKATSGTQIKTVEFFLYQYNSATEITAGNGIDNTAYGATCGSSDGDPSVTINIPESSVTFRSVVLEWRTWQSAASGTAASAYDIQFCNSSTTASETSSATVMTSSAENNMVLVRLNVTSAMLSGSNTYWFDARLSGVTRNLDSLKLIVTYEYDQTSTTQLKTVYFYGNQQTGAASTTDLDAVINPNLTEANISVVDSFAIFKGQVNLGTTDTTINGSFAASGTCETTSRVAVADGSRTSAYGYIVLFDMSNSINLTSSNCIRHGVSQNTFARSIEWVITYTYSYYGANEADDLVHTKTVRYMLGTYQSSIGTSQTAIGSAAIYLPENKPSSPFVSVYVQYFSSLDNAAALTTCISTASGCSGTYSTQSAINYGDTAEQSGGITALHNVTTFFNSNWSNGTTFYVSAAAGVANDIFGTSAEVIITYRYNADTSSTSIKTVWFWVGQERQSRTNTAFNQDTEPSQANFNTWWPETGTKTFRNGAVYGAFNYNGTTGVGTTTVTSTITVDDLSVSGTDTASVDILGTGENLTREMLVKISTQVPSPFAAQTDINFSMTTNSTTLPVFRSPIAYFTVETATSLAPEKALTLIPLAVIVPLIFNFYFKKRKKFLKQSKNLVYVK